MHSTVKGYPFDALPQYYGDLILTSAENGNEIAI